MMEKWIMRLRVECKTSIQSCCVCEKSMKIGAEKCMTEKLGLLRRRYNMYNVVVRLAAQTL